MGILIDNNTKVLVQGITGAQGRFHTQLMLEYGTNVVAGVTPTKHGTSVCGVPVFETVKEAMSRCGPNTSVIFVPAPFAADAAYEAIEAGITTIVIITEHVPVRDAVGIMVRAKKHNVTVIGPNTPGIIVPGSCKVGIMPSSVFKKGSVGIVSRSGTLSYEIAEGLTAKGLGQSVCIGLGGDPIVGLDFVDVLRLLGEDKHTEAVVLIGEIGGDLEQRAAEFISKEKYSKPVVAYIAGSTSNLPREVRIGHAGAVIWGKTGTAEDKVRALKDSGVTVGAIFSDILRELKH